MQSNCNHSDDEPKEYGILGGHNNTGRVLGFYVVGNILYTVKNNLKLVHSGDAENIVTKTFWPMLEATGKAPGIEHVTKVLNE